jgi:predicted amidohydrolase
MIVRVAATAWKVRQIRGDGGYFGHLHDLVSGAHDEGADIVVLPELHVLELMTLATEVREHLVPKYLVQYAEAIENWLQRISDSSGMTIVGGSHFKETDLGIKNVCAIAVPHQPLIFAEKNNLTAYEKEMWELEHGEGLSMGPFGLGVTVCYDSEFPEAARQLAEEGMQIQVVPAWTETRQGFQRVRWSCLARAVENQTFVVHSSLLGSIGREPMPESFGSAAIIAPSVEPFPVDAILRETVINEEGIIVADLNFELLEQCRLGGEVTNWEDRHIGEWTVAPYVDPLLKMSAPSDQDEDDDAPESDL